MSGTLRLKGSTSGYSELQAPAVAGDQTFILPVEGGTLLTTDSPAPTLTLESGIVTSPSLTFEGDSNTGIYSPGANELAITTGGGQRLVADSSGNIGIGTSGPQEKLHLIGKARIDDTDTIAISLKDNGSGNFYGFIGRGTDEALYINGGGTTPELSLRTVGTERLRIDSSGNVGIGTTSPGTKLDVSGNAIIGATGGGAEGGQITFRDSSGSSRGVVDISGTDAFRMFSTTADQEFVIGSFGSNGNIDFYTNNQQRMHINSSGNVGIGTSSPQEKLHVREGDIVIGQTSGASTNIRNYIKFGRETNPKAAIGFLNTDSNGRGDLLFMNSAVSDGNEFSNGDEVMRIDINGNVGIGTSAPGTELEVNGDIGIGRVAGGYTFREVVGGGERAGIISNSSNALIFNTGSAVEQMRISGTGDMLIAKNATNVATVGIELRADGLGTFTKSGGIPLIVNRNTNDGTLVSLRQGNTQEGSINVSGGNVSFNQFLGSHWAALTDWSRPEIKIGTIIETINELTDWKYAAIEVEGEQKKICYNGTAAPGDTVSVEYEGKIYEGIVELETNPEFNKAVKVKVNDMAASKAVYGVFVGWNTDSDLDGGIWNDMYVGAVGNYVIRMAAGQNPEIGDLVESNGAGCGVVQDDDIIRTKTVAKITTTIPQVTYDDGSFLVTCVLYCG